MAKNSRRLGGGRTWGRVDLCMRSRELACGAGAGQTIYLPHMQHTHGGPNPLAEWAMPMCRVSRARLQGDELGQICTALRTKPACAANWLLSRCVTYDQHRSIAKHK